MKKSVITVGNFDGVHRAHQALLAEAQAAADGQGLEVVVLCFDRHPAASLRPDQAPAPLMAPAQRAAALVALGIEHVVNLPADPSILSLSPEAFVARMVKAHHPALWLEGPDFRFGADRVGDMAMLRALGEKFDFQVRAIEPVEIDLRTGEQVRISSTLIRWLVEHGRVDEAARCLGRPFAVAGDVVRGEQLGRTLGFPTLNLNTAERKLPADGVYAGWTMVQGQSYAAAISVGTKPSCGDHARVFEAYLLDYHGDLYGQHMEVNLIRWLRDQIKFETTSDLVDQINRDVDRVRGLREADILGPQTAGAP